MARRPKPVLVVDIAGFSWKRRAVLLTSVVAGVWVFVGPLLELTGGLSPLKSLGLWGYVGLVGLSASAVIVAEVVQRRRYLGTLDLVDIDVVLTSTGQRVPVRAAADMLVGRLADKLLSAAARMTSIGTLVSVLQSLYETNLLVACESGFREVSNSETLREAGIGPGDVCKIRGYIRAEYRAPFASVLSSAETAAVDEGRAAGRVYFDEDVAVALDEAVTRGILTRARAKELEAARPGARIVVVDNG